MLTPEQMREADTLKADLIADGSLVDAGDHYIFTRDVAFPSVEIATYIVSGENPLDAESVWKGDDDRSLRAMKSENN